METLEKSISDKTATVAIKPITQSNEEGKDDEEEGGETKASAMRKRRAPGWLLCQLPQGTPDRAVL